MSAGVHVSERLDCQGEHVVRLAPRNPVSAQLAIHAISQWSIGAALLDDERSLLPTAGELLADCMSVVSAQLLELAKCEAPLSERQKAILHLLASDVDHHPMARRLSVSRSTLQHELRTLRRLTGCTGSVGLVVAALTWPSVVAFLVALMGLGHLFSLALPVGDGAQLRPFLSRTGASMSPAPPHGSSRAPVQDRRSR